MLHPFKLLKENVKTTIAKDFGGHLTVHVTKGIGIVPGWFPYDRASKAYDTVHKEIWEAFAFHDWCCVELAAGREVYGTEQQVLVYDQEGADSELFLLMLKAVQRVFERLLREGLHRSQATKICKGLTRRALVYHRGVRFWNGIAKLMRIR
jgi:hypothetical protein